MYLVSYLIALIHTVVCYRAGTNVEFRFELLFDMTIVPQQYTLHCVTISDDRYTITLYMVMINKYIVGIVEMKTVSDIYYTVVTLHMIILLILQGIQRQLVDHLIVNQLMMIKYIDVMSYEVALAEIVI